MASIKGLTVKIGGDTSELLTALEGVNKKSKDLSSELGDVNRLLKLDPGNTDLLAQKQKILADAVANTGDKLAKLKEAEKQVQAQFERGEVSEEQVRALQREIIATEKKMEGYERAIEETNEALRGMDDGAEEAEESSGRLGETLANVAKTGLAAATAAATALVTGLVACAEATREYRTEMGKLETAFVGANLTSESATETYKTLQGVLGETDQSVEAAQQIALLAGSEEEAAKWADLAAGLVGKFGNVLQPEAFYEAANETLKLGEATGAYAQALEQSGFDVESFNEGLAECATYEERQAYLLNVSNQMLARSADIYRETNAEVIRANDANEAWMSSMAEVGRAVEPILTDFKELGAVLLSDAVPAVTAMAEAFRGLMNGDEGASENFGGAISDLVSGLISKITEALPTIAKTGLSIISALVTSIGQQLPVVLKTGGQILSQVVSGIATNLPSVAKSALDSIGGFVQGLRTNLPLVLEQGRELLMSLANGISENLPDLISQGLDIILNFAQTIYDNAPTLIQTGFDVLSNLVSGIMNSLPTLIAKVPEIISTFANTINDNFPTILAKGAQLIWQIIQGIISAIPTLIANIPKIITAIVDVWEAFNWLNLGKKAITALKDGVLKMVGAVKSAGQNVMNSITGVIQNLPNNLLNFGKNAVSNLGSAISSGLNTVKLAASNVMAGVVNTVKQLPSKLLTVGKDLVKGLWNGISDMTGWIIDKIQSFGDSVLSGIKSFFGIASPSRVFRDEVGAMLAEGMAVGIEENADAPLAAMSDLSDDLLGEADSLNGLTLERKLQNTFAEPAGATGQLSLLDKLDRILVAIERGQVLTLDKDLLIGGTANDYDTKLGQRRALAVRGAL